MTFWVYFGRFYHQLCSLSHFLAFLSDKVIFSGNFCCIILEPVTEYGTKEAIDLPHSPQLKLQGGERWRLHPFLAAANGRRALGRVWGNRKVICCIGGGESVAHAKRERERERNQRLMEWRSRDNYSRRRGPLQGVMCSCSFNKAEPNLWKWGAQLLHQLQCGGFT